MADPNSTINQIVADPDFVKLSPGDQKAILLKVKGAGPGDVPSDLRMGLHPLSGGDKRADISSGGNPGNISSMDSQRHGADLKDSAIDIARPMVSSAAAGLTSAVVAASGIGTGGVSSLASPAAGIGAYGLVDALLQHLKTKKDNSIASDALNLKEGSVPATVVNSAEQYGMGKLGDAAFGLIGRGIKSVLPDTAKDLPEVFNLHPTTSQAAKAEGMPILAGVAKTFEDLNVSSKAKALDRTAGKGFTEALQVAKDADMIFNRDPQMMLKITQDAIEPSSTRVTPVLFKEGSNLTPHETIDPVKNKLADSFSKVDKLIADPQKLDSLLITAQNNGVNENMRKTLGGYQFMRMMNAATEFEKTATGLTQNPVRIDPSKLTSMWTDPEMQESYKTLYSAETRANMSQFFKNIENTQDKLNPSTFSKFWVMHAGVGFGAGLLTGSLSGGLEGSGGVLGLYVGAQQLGKMLANPSVARTVVALAGGEPLGKSTEFAGKLIVRALNGATVSILNNKGQKIPGIIRDGKFTPLPQEK